MARSNRHRSLVRPDTHSRFLTIMQAHRESVPESFKLAVSIINLC